jgi:hypothetical protein
VRVALARHEAEAEMLAGILEGHGIPRFVRRTMGADVPEMMAGGMREVLVPEARALEAHALLDPLPETPDGA